MRSWELKIKVTLHILLQLQSLSICQYFLLAFTSILLKLTLLLLFTMACKQDLSFQLKYLFSICWCPSEAIIFGGLPPSSPSKIW